MGKWMLGLAIGSVAALSIADASTYRYGSCSDSYCGNYCDPCCDPCCDSCGDDCCSAGFEVLAEYLYIRPHMCDLNYVIVDDRAFGDVSSTAVAPVDAYLPSGKELGLCPDFASSFRLGAGYLFNCHCNDITVTYTRVYTTDHHHVDAVGDGGLWITYAHPRYNGLRLNNANLIDLTQANTQPIGTLAGEGSSAVAALHTRVEYNMVDGVVAKRSKEGCNLWMRSFVGLRWADISICKTANYAGTVTDPDGVVTDSSEVPVTTAARLFLNQRTHAHSRTDTWGIGPRVGTEFRYAIACGFGLGAQVGASILVGESCHHIDQWVTRDAVAAASDVTLTSPLTLDSPSNIEQSMDISNHSRCHLFPEIDARLGVNYLWCCGDCFSLLVEVGWEFVSYINAVGRIRFNDVAGTSREVCESFNLDGLYVSFRVGF